MRNWQGKVVVDIREFYVKDGKQLPGKKGPFLSALSYQFLFEFDRQCACVIFAESMLVIDCVNGMEKFL